MKILVASWVDQFQTESFGYTVFLSFEVEVSIIIILICEYVAVDVT